MKRTLFRKGIRTHGLLSQARSSKVNVALDRTIILGLEIVLDHRSLSSICWRLWWAPQYSQCRPCPPWPGQAGAQGVRLVLYQFIAEEGLNNEILGDIHCNKVKLQKGWSLSRVQSRRFLLPRLPEHYWLTGQSSPVLYWLA